MKSSNFNTYYENINTNFWCNLCVGNDVLRHYEKGELFADEGRIAKYLGYIKLGAVNRGLAGLGKTHFINFSKRA